MRWALDAGVTKFAGRQIRGEAGGRRRVKGDMDIELAVNAMELTARIDEMALFSGDGDFRPLIHAVQRHQPPMIADELRRQADVFIDLKDLESRIGRDHSER